MRDEFYFPSKDGNTEIHTIEWKPDKEVKAVLQICHGMMEYIERYDEFAQFLCEKGYYVVGNDHLGHGKSVQAKSEYGFFNEKYGNVCVLGDIHTLRQCTAKKVSRRALFHAWTQHGIITFEAVYPDVWKRAVRRCTDGNCSRS